LHNARNLDLVFSEMNALFFLALLTLIPLIDFFPQLNGTFPGFPFWGKSLKYLLERFVRAMRGMRTKKIKRMF
jgi:hypothetical protein